MKEYEYTGKAMGTDYAIAIVTNSKELADTLSNQAVKEIQLCENIFSRFLPDSELSKLNQTKEQTVSEIFMKVTEEAYKLFLKTKGIFNPLFQIERLGYDRDFSNIKESALKNMSSEEYNIDFSQTIIDKNDLHIFLQTGQKLDFGGILKGYLAELLCKKIINYSDKISGVIINIGGDIHTEGVDILGNKFIFKIYNPITKEDDISVILYNESLATSGTYKRHWVVAGSNYHHILELSGNNNPDTDIVSASIIHKEGSKSEAFTKVLISIGLEKTKELLQDEEFKFIIIKKNGQIIKNI